MESNNVWKQFQIILFSVKEHGETLRALRSLLGFSSGSASLWLSSNWTQQVRATEPDLHHPAFNPNATTIPTQETRRSLNHQVSFSLGAGQWLKDSEKLMDKNEMGRVSVFPLLVWTVLTRDDMKWGVFDSFLCWAGTILTRDDVRSSSSKLQSTCQWRRHWGIQTEPWH